MLLLLGFPSAYGARVTLCLCFMFIYLLVVLGNLLITSHIWLDAHQHSPTDFFLGHLSFLDICYSSVTLPKIPGDSSSLQKTISFVGCITQIYFLCSGGSECVLLAAVGYGGSNVINPLFCEMPFLLKMSCSPNAPLNETVSRALAGTIKAAGTQRPFATCTSRLTVGSLFFGRIQGDGRGPHPAVTPTLTPIICSLRNSEVKGATRRALHR
ncbi:PREDICTED: olfactory receptor-like protein DTMT, partial [Pterocles gutturalis]|uniref:olfactory receptor-like protein DTMT n=1 Tax=Pterocles gutturalis TaxID=240206 RepID=UPI0005287E83